MLISPVCSRPCSFGEAFFGLFVAIFGVCLSPLLVFLSSPPLDKKLARVERVHEDPRGPHPLQELRQRKRRLELEERHVLEEHRARTHAQLSAVPVSGVEATEEKK